MNFHEVSNELASSLDEPAESVPPLFLRPLPQWIVNCFLGTISLFALQLIVTMRVDDPPTSLEDSFRRLGWLLDLYS